MPVDTEVICIGILPSGMFRDAGSVPRQLSIHRPPAIRPHKAAKKQRCQISMYSNLDFMAYLQLEFEPTAAALIVERNEVNNRENP